MTSFSSFSLLKLQNVKTFILVVSCLPLCLSVSLFNLCRTTISPICPSFYFPPPPPEKSPLPPLHKPHPPSTPPLNLLTKPTTHTQTHTHLSVAWGLKANQKAIEKCFGVQGHNRGVGGGRWGLVGASGALRWGPPTSSVFVGCRLLSAAVKEAQTSRNWDRWDDLEGRNNHYIVVRPSVHRKLIHHVCFLIGRG